MFKAQDGLNLVEVFLFSLVVKFGSYTKMNALSSSTNSDFESFERSMVLLLLRALINTEGIGLSLGTDPRTSLRFSPSTMIPCYKKNVPFDMYSILHNIITKIVYIVNINHIRSLLLPGVSFHHKSTETLLLWVYQISFQCKGTMVRLLYRFVKVYCGVHP